MSKCSCKVCCKEHTEEPKVTKDCTCCGGDVLSLVREEIKNIVQSDVKNLVHELVDKYLEETKPPVETETYIAPE